MRKLAHIEKIDWISPIEEKDRIVLAGVLGWTVIVQKSEYSVGDKVVFCEIDSVLPEKPEFEFLVQPKKRDSGFPDFVSKTDETRIQNAPSMLDLPVLWVATEKVDGQSGTFTLRRTQKKSFLRREKFDFAVCSRNRRLWDEDDSSYWQVAKKYNIREVLEDMISVYGVDWVAIQGECVAPKVQGNKYKVTEPDLYVFNIILPNGRLDSVSAEGIAETYGLKFVPILSVGMNLQSMKVEDVLNYATGKSRLADTLREGIVFRSQGGTQSFKAVSPEFLMKYNA